MRALLTKGAAGLFGVIVCALTALLSPNTLAAENRDQGVATATSVQGTVEVRRAGQTQWQPVKLNDSFRPGDSVRVGERSRADIQLLNQSVLRLNANSSLTVEAPKEEKTGVVDLIRGAVHFFSRGPNSLDVKTPFTVAGVRGTEFLISLEPKATLLTVFEGTVVAENAAGSLTLRDGQSGIAEAGKAPVTRVVVRPRDAVQWALYYPPVVQDRQAPAYQAQKLLAVGAVDEARSEIERALKSAPNNADALSLLSVMTLVQGDKDKALQIAQKAVDAAPKSATALIARSYARQASFNLEGARADVQKAVELDPRNALGWARLAELQSAFGEYDKTTEAAQKAVALDPNLALTQTVLGFAYLTSIKIKEARETFEKAISLDQAAPLPRLGLGLAKIRDGELEAGGREIEVAASLDPNSSIVRSYLGKVYYEEKRTGLDEREFAMAKKLDPNDPTPWFYDAIAKQTTNRPVEALESLEKARELNDNRAVYRSELLLDSDAAARASSQARIYNDLGFELRGLVEGWEAVNRDPCNFCAHRFLADSYTKLPRHEIARVSELLQSQLLSPVTNTPLQPRLAESNLALISSLGPGVASFNEFNPLFTRDGVTLQVNGMAGSKSTTAGEMILSGVAGKAGFSVGFSEFNTDGFRTNSDQKESLANLFLQYDFTPSTSVQAEYRYRDSERGDVALRFFPNAFFPGLRTEVNYDTYRIGLRHAFSPASVVLASFMLQDRYTAQPDSSPTPPVLSADRRGPDHAKSGEVQNIYRSSRLNLTSGLGYFDIDGTIDQSSSFAFPGIPQICIPGPFPNCFIFFQPAIPPATITSSTSVKTDLNHVNAYAYANYDLDPALTLTLGLSYDSVDGSSVSVGKQNQTNPKLGLVWQPTAATTVRAAAFRTFKRTLITDQTLEPTQVAGFNQFFDDINATDAWRYGVGIDQKFGGNVFGGVEVSKRDLDSPYNLGGVQRFIEKVDESQAKVYAYWAPRHWLALRSEYRYDKWESEGKTGRPTDLKTQWLPLSANVFHRSGWGGGITATYIKQDGTFLQGSASDDFWLFDLGIQYRLPKRYGFVSAGVRNAGDQQFNYYDLDTKNPQITPARMAFVQFSLALQ